MRKITGTTIHFAQPAVNGARKFSERTGLQAERSAGSPKTSNASAKMYVAILTPSVAKDFYAREYVFLHATSATKIIRTFSQNLYYFRLYMRLKICVRKISKDRLQLLEVFSSRILSKIHFTMLIMWQAKKAIIEEKKRFNQNQITSTYLYKPLCLFLISEILDFCRAVLYHCIIATLVVDILSLTLCTHETLVRS